MMDRRVFLLSMPALLFLARGAVAGGENLAAAFARLSPPERQQAQETLSAGGFYSGRIDGAFGPATRAGLLNAAAFIKDNSYGKVVYDLSATVDADRFLADLTRGELDKYLWGEGDESEGG